METRTEMNSGRTIEQRALAHARARFGPEVTVDRVTGVHGGHGLFQAYLDLPDEEFIAIGMAFLL